MTTSFLSNSIEVQQTKQAVEARYGSCPDSPADFAELSLRIKVTTSKMPNETARKHVTEFGGTIVFCL